MNSFTINKSLTTNLIAGLCFLGSFLWEGSLASLLRISALFSLSGALTNWLAVYMLFEKIPFLFGSGIIPNKFELFKKTIENMILENFFSEKNFLDLKNLPELKSKIEKMLDVEKLFDSLLEKIQQSTTAGNVLFAFGGNAILESFRTPFVTAVNKELNKKSFSAMLFSKNNYPDFLKSIKFIIQSELQKLSPQKVKELVANIIREHLGWLVVWGGVFGALIGFVTGLLFYI